MREEFAVARRRAAAAGIVDLKAHRHDTYGFDDYAVMQEYRNIMCRMFGANSHPYRNVPITPQMFRMAQAQLDGCEVVGIAEAYRTSMKLMLHVLNASHRSFAAPERSRLGGKRGVSGKGGAGGDSDVHRNVAASEPFRAALAKNATRRALIAAMNRFDVRLYHRGRARFCRDLVATGMLATDADALREVLDGHSGAPGSGAGPCAEFVNRSGASRRWIDRFVAEHFQTGTPDAPCPDVPKFDDEPLCAERIPPAGLHTPNISAPFHPIRSKFRSHAGTNLTLTWPSNAALVTESGHRWCALQRDNWSCVGSRYADVLRQTPGFAVDELGLERYPAGTVALVEGNSILAEPLFTIVCESAADVWKLDGRISNSVLAHVDAANVTLLAFDNDPVWNRDADRTAELLTSMQYVPSVIVLGDLNGDSHQNDVGNRTRAFRSWFPHATVLDWTGRNIGDGCRAAPFNDCRAVSGGHTCMPGPLYRDAERLSRAMLDAATRRAIPSR